MPKGPHRPDQSAGPPANRYMQCVRITEAEKRAYLRELEKHGVLSWAARAVGRSHAGFLSVRRRDPQFDHDVEEAIAQANGAIELAAIERGVKGVERLEVSAGQVVKDDQGNPVTRREYSDTLLLAVLRARDQRFRSKQSIDVSHTHHNGGATISSDDIFLLDEEDRDHFLELLSKIEQKRRGNQSQPQQQLTSSVEDAEWSEAEAEDEEDEDAALAAIM